MNLTFPHEDDLIVAYKYTNRKEEKQENSHKKHIFTLEMKHIKNTHQTHFRVMKKIYPQKMVGTASVQADKQR